MHRVDQSKAEPLKPSDTPETDKELHAIWYGGSRYSFPDHARRMERERDQARRDLDVLAKAWDDVEREMKLHAVELATAQTMRVLWDIVRDTGKGKNCE